MKPLQVSTNGISQFTATGVKHELTVTSTKGLSPGISHANQSRLFAKYRTCPRPCAAPMTPTGCPWCLHTVDAQSWKFLQMAEITSCHSRLAFKVPIIPTNSMFWKMWPGRTSSISIACILVFCHSSCAAANSGDTAAPRHIWPNLSGPFLSVRQVKYDKLISLPPSGTRTETKTLALTLEFQMQIHSRRANESTLRWPP